ncbi:MAG TPA: cation:proton antiporter, partial [Allocoleopsis sp.]
GITAKVLAEIQRLSSREGQIIIGAAVLDDVLGIIVLAVVASLAKTGEVQVSNILYLIVSASVFLVGTILLGRLLSPYFVALVDRLQTRGQLILSSLIFAFILSYVGAVIQLEAILGAFAAGLVLAETEKRDELEEQVIPIADMLVPVFFVVVGARTDVSVLNPFDPANREGLIIATFLVIVAILGKVVTGLAVFGQPGINRLAIGVGMVPRGEVGLVFAGVGSATGVLSESLDAAIIVMVILTTFLAPPLLRVVFREPAMETVESLQETKS